MRFVDVLLTNFLLSVWPGSCTHWLPQREPHGKQTGEVSAEPGQRFQRLRCNNKNTYYIIKNIG